ACLGSGRVGRPAPEGAAGVRCLVISGYGMPAIVKSARFDRITETPTDSVARATSAPDMKLNASLLCAAAAATLSFSVQAQTAKPDLAKGAALFGQVCVACHAADGNSTTPENPKLAGQHPEYLVKQLREFKSGKRSNAIMSGFAATLSDDDMRNIAAWLSGQVAKTGAATDKDLVRLGERIYRGGIADRQIAACAGCHSP